MSYLSDPQKTSCPHCADEKGRRQPKVDRLRVALANVAEAWAGLSWPSQDEDAEPRSEGEVEVMICHGKVILDCDVTKWDRMPVLTVRSRAGRRRGSYPAQGTTITTPVPCTGGKDGK